MTTLDLGQSCALTAGGAMWASQAIDYAGIPAFTMSDGPLGIASGKVDERDVARLSPCPTLLGATWDRELCRRVGEVTGHEAVARGIDAVLAPNVNLARSPLAGRAFEYFSEDPVLTGVLAAEWTKGLQATGTASIPKHLVCNDSETDRDNVNVRVDERTLREVYLLPFEYCVNAGCAGLMAAYNKVNDAWCSEQAHVLTDIVKGEWAFPGLVMSDWFGTHSSVGTISAGLDLEMPGPARFMGSKLLPLVESGEVEATRIADAAARVAYTARKATGAKAPAPDAHDVDETLVEAAAAGFTVLRNEGSMLPLAPGEVKRLAVIGPNAFAPCFQGGTFAKISISPEAPTPVETLRALYGETCEVVCEPGIDPQPRLPAMPLVPAHDLGDGCTAGLTVRYYDQPGCAGPVRSAETRNTNSLVWFVGVHDDTADFARPGSLRAEGRYTARHTGLHSFHLGSTGLARILVDGEEVIRCGGAVPAKDVMGHLKRGDSDAVTLRLEAGQEITVTVEFDWTGGRVAGLWYGLRGPDSAEEMLARAVEAARDAEAVLLFVGETSDSSVESKDRKDTRLPQGQLDLIDAVSAANPRTAVIVNVGHAFDAGFADTAQALLSVWYPGEGYARALAEVLSGQREPSGRLPVTIAAQESHYPAFDLTPEADGSLPYREGTAIGYRGLAAAGHRARYPFGYGLGYGVLDWSEPGLDGDQLHLTLANPHAREVSDVVQVYRDEPERALVGFARFTLAPGERRRVAVPLEAMALRIWSEDRWSALAPSGGLRLARHCEDEGVVVANAALASN
ncbi:glycoside hydrolase family 3 protein [Novosphingobium profundi]|uniref:beta-glucosidase n=1 Tax=Novosphingobium profundi TaxID=1774954 RepID=UPI001BD9B4BD|nr:glycoside hydrolase family 3 C-terminal domain-containing protein [Novosphingobium profundi]MBT0670919.1 glycoside hydrolase family 3 protein [Novosphingobium profundi]